VVVPSGGGRRSVLLIALKYQLLSSPNATIDALVKRARARARASIHAFDAQSFRRSPRRERARGERERKSVDRSVPTARAIRAGSSPSECANAPVGSNGSIKTNASITSSARECGNARAL